MAVTPRWGLAVALVLAWGASARACPVCGSETGRQVRAKLFDAGFGPVLVQTLAPFPVLLGIVAALHFGLPSRLRTAPGGAPRRESEAAAEPDTPASSEAPP
jgi:hypothetical protein